MTLIDFIDVSSDDEILKDHKVHIGGHEVHPGMQMDTIYLSSDDETARDDHGACGQGHKAQSQAPLYDPTAFVGEAKGIQLDFEPSNGAEATVSFLVGENVEVGIDTSPSFDPSSTAVLPPDKKYKIASRAATHGFISSSPKATKSRESKRLQKKYKDCCKKSRLDFAMELKSSRLVCFKTTSGRRKRKNTRQQKSKKLSRTLHRDQPQDIVLVPVNIRFSETM